MRETWIDADDKTIRDDIVSIAKEKTGLTNFKSTGVLRGFIEVLAACVIFIYKTAINPIYRNATLDGATGVFLSFWGLALGVVRKQVRCDASFICDGKNDCSGFEYLAADGDLTFPLVPADTGRGRFWFDLYAAGMAESVTAAESLSVSVTALLRCNGSKTPSCSLCDGSIICDGSYSGFDGRYYREDILEEVI